MNSQNQTDIRLPWRKVQDRLLLRPGETSLWFGVSGCGKSMVARHILLGALSDGHRCCAAALEYRPQDWMCRLVRQASAEERPTQVCARNTMQAIRQRLWLYSGPGAAKIDLILDVFTDAAQHHGARLFLIDSYTKLSTVGDDYPSHQQTMGRISGFARDLNVHVMVVAHTRKTVRDESPPPEMGDVQGAGALTDLADTVVAIWRNKPKEHAIEHGVDTPDIRAKPDCLLVTHKQRSGERDLMIRLWFDRASHQYVGNPGERPVRMLQTAEGVA